VQELFNIEQFYHRKFNKLKLNILEKSGQAFYTIAKPLMNGIYCRYSQFLYLKASEILDFE
jgi:hypothetical protein